jgi:hypothetical protein
MAFSAVHELIVDSSFRLNSSVTTSSSFEYQFPFPFPSVGQSQLRLADFWIPNSFYTFNVPYQTVSAGTYTGTQIVTKLTGLLGGATITWDESTQKFTFNSVPSPNTHPWYILMGWSTGSVNINTLTSPQAATLGRDRYSRMYIRLNSFENKMFLPTVTEEYISPSVSLKSDAYYQKKTSIFLSFVAPLNYKNGQDYFFLNQNINQKLLVAHSYFNTNQILKVDLLDAYGQSVNLNGRDWGMSLRIEPINYVDT